jgi:hypothetical protein
VMKNEATTALSIRMIKSALVSVEASVGTINHEYKKFIVVDRHFLNSAMTSFIKFANLP